MEVTLKIKKILFLVFILLMHMNQFNQLIVILIKYMQQIIIMIKLFFGLTLS